MATNRAAAIRYDRLRPATVGTGEPAPYLSIQHCWHCGRTTTTIAVALTRAKHRRQQFAPLCGRCLVGMGLSLEGAEGCAYRVPTAQEMAPLLAQYGQGGQTD